MTVVETPARTLPITEVFGPTFQGEGPNLGALAAFIRVGGCNLTCRDCDTPYTWDGRRYDLRHEIAQTGVGDIVGRLDELAPDVPLVVLTGGEPLLYQKRAALQMLLGVLTGRGQRVEVETNGTIAPVVDMVRWPVTFNVSPKLAGAMSDDDPGRRIDADALAAFAGLARYSRAAFKFVCSTPAHVDEAAELIREHRIPRNRVWIMPEGVTPDAVHTHGRAIADAVLGHSLNMTTRLHVLLWPDTTRGR